MDPQKEEDLLVQGHLQAATSELQVAGTGSLVFLCRIPGMSEFIF